MNAIELILSIDVFINKQHSNSGTDRFMCEHENLDLMKHKCVNPGFKIKGMHQWIVIYLCKDCWGKHKNKFQLWVNAISQGYIITKTKELI